MKGLIILSAIFACAFAASYPLASPISRQQLTVGADISEISTRVSGGYVAAANQFPWMVSIRAGTGANMTTCGGSLISTLWVLTSAACVQGYGSITLGFGSVILTAPAQSQTQTAINFIVHPSYVASTLANNVALVRLNTPVIIGANVQAIRLAALSQQNSNFVGTLLTVSGWGQTLTGGAISNTLNWVNKRAILNAACSAIYGAAIVTNNVVCANGWDNIAQNACDGDAGGPLVANEAGINTLIGIVSFVSNRGCTAGDPAGYTRVPSYVAWVQTHTGIVARP